jgi:hypothetical protein
LATHDPERPHDQLGELPDWFSLFQTVEAFGALNCTVRPWELLQQPDCWGVWANDYVRAKHDAAAMRAQIDAARAAREGQA